MRRTDGRLLALVVLTLGALDYASEVHELTDIALGEVGSRPAHAVLPPDDSGREGSGWDGGPADVEELMEMVERETQATEVQSLAGNATSALPPVAQSNNQLSTLKTINPDGMDFDMPKDLKNTLVTAATTTTRTTKDNDGGEKESKEPPEVEDKGQEEVKPCKDGKPPQPHKANTPSPQDKDEKAVGALVTEVLAANNARTIAEKAAGKDPLNKGDPDISTKIDDVLVVNGQKQHAHTNSFEAKPLAGVKDNTTQTDADGDGVVDAPPSPPTGAFISNDAPTDPQPVSDVPASTKETPQEWTMYETPDGEKFYRNDETGVAQWNAPAAKDKVVKTVSVPAGGNVSTPAVVTNATKAKKKRTPIALANYSIPNTEVFKSYAYTESNKIVKTCCTGIAGDGKAEMDLLDIKGDGNLGADTTPAHCEELCRKTGGCMFYQINPKALTDRCLGFKECSKQCDVNWKKPSSIFRMGTESAKPAGAVKLPSPEYKKHAGKQCSGAAAAAAEDFVASAASGCESKCNELGTDCSGFVFTSASKCMFKTGKLTVQAGKFTEDNRDCYEKVAAALPWKYEKHAGKQCTGSNGDAARDFIASSDFTDSTKCEEKCSLLGEKCVGFVHVRSGNDAGKCHFRTGTLKISTSPAEDDRDCYKKVQNLISAETVKKGNETSALPIVVSGGSGGDNGDKGGANSNGVYQFDIMRNGKPSYKRSEGGIEYTILWEESGKSDWGAVNLAGNQNAWVLKGGKHYRFFVASEKDTPPQAGWTPRTGAAEGTLQVDTQQPGTAKSGGASSGWYSRPSGLDVTGATGTCGAKINGAYTAQDTLNNKPVYKNGDGYSIRFESATSSSLARNVWVVYGNGAYALTIDSTKDLPPTAGWQAPEGSCVEGASDVKISTQSANAPPPAPSIITISGGNGGFVHEGSNDEGGMAVNGKYTKESMANGKPTYFNGNGCEIKFETTGEYGHDKLAKGNTWVVLCKSHYRYFAKSESATPPRGGWTKRDGAATGSIQVMAGMGSFKPVEITGAVSQCPKCNGKYEQDGFYNGKPMYKNIYGYNITYQMQSKSDAAAVMYGGGFDVWLLAGDGEMRYFDISSEPSAPTTGWGWVTNSAKGHIKVCEGTGCAGGADKSTTTQQPPTASGDYHVFDGCPKAGENSLPIALDKSAKDFSSRGNSFVPPGAVSSKIAVLCCKGSGADLMCTSRSDGSASDDGTTLKGKCLGTGKTFAQAQAACQSIPTSGNGASWHLCTEAELKSSGKTGTGSVCCGHGARCNYEDHYTWIKSGAKAGSGSGSGNMARR